ncbi:MAG: hypothetical protein JO250_03220 [Armatimonadetes bacterium]|nr:hypothetical protein [Armatimonadota bacterium]
MPTVLLTGFEPFGEFKSNPSQQIAERLDGQTVGEARIVGLTLPVAFGEDTARAFAAIADRHPALVLSLGLNAGATCLEVERFAVNLRAEAHAEGQTPIIADGFAALSATLDAERVARAIRERAGLPAQAHSYAGSYLCNHILYQTLHYAQQWDLRYRAGFIHLPLSCEQAIAEGQWHRPSLPLDSMVMGVRAAIEEVTRG